MSPIAAGKAECVWPAGRLLGEGVWWSAQEQAVYWVDIKNPAILRHRPGDGAKDVWPMPEPIGCCVPCADGSLLGAFRSGFYRLQLGAPGTAPARSFAAAPPGHAPGDRFNDGAVHPDGSFWAGTMDDAERDERGHFWRLDPSGRLDHVAGPYMVCNGPAFSPDGRWAYLTDSAARTIYRLDCAHIGAPPELFVRFGEADGYPDGMTTDSEGRLWIAFWDGAKVRCIAADGTLGLELPLPVSRPTRCAFGGDGLGTLYVSSASIGLDGLSSVKEPFAGGLFTIDILGARGWPASICTGPTEIFPR